MAELFEKSPPTINEHLKNIYEEGELEPDSTIRKFRTVAREGARDVERLLDHYKLHWAIHGHTAPELIRERADSTQPNMGLTSWSGARVSKKDVSVAKNYLTEDEITALNRIVTMYLDYAESQAARQRPMTMKDWANKLDAFLEFNEHEILQNAGQVSAIVAKQLAEAEYDQYETRRRETLAGQKSDFDAFIEHTQQLTDKGKL